MTIEVKDIQELAIDIKSKVDSKFQEYDDKLEGLKSEIETELVSLKRPGGSTSKASKSADKKAKSALAGFIRKGDSSGLMELEQKAMSAGSDPDGGFAVPEYLERDIETLEHEVSAVMRLARMVDAQGSVYKKLVNKRGTASGWVGETDNRPETGTPEMAEVSIEVGEVYANPKLTQKLIDDAMFDAEAFISGEITEEFSDQLGVALISGDGVNKPKGILAHTITNESDDIRAFGSLQAVVTAGVSGVTADDIKTMKSKLKAKYRAGAAWIMNESTALTLSIFKDGNGRYLWQDSLHESEHDTLLGYPVYIDENMPDIANSAYPIAFGNFDRGYHIPRRLGVRLLRDPYTSKPYVNFYATRRIGGGIVNSEAIKLLEVKAA